MAELKAICVYCGSSSGQKPVYARAAEDLGREIAASGLQLVYGGGSVGLMGIVARAVLAHGGAVTGIIPRFLADREVMLTEAHELIVTQDMHERKRAMFDRADAFVALPGGIGTLEELVEMATWAQLGRHRKPILLVNVDGFWDPLRTLLEHMVEEQFVTRQFIDDIGVVDRPDQVIPTLRGAAARLLDAALHQHADAEPLSNL